MRQTTPTRPRCRALREATILPSTRFFLEVQHKEDNMAEKWSTHEFDRCRWLEDRDRFFTQRCCVTSVVPPKSQPDVVYDVELKPSATFVALRSNADAFAAPKRNPKKRWITFPFRWRRRTRG